MRSKLFAGIICILILIAQFAAAPSSPAADSPRKGILIVTNRQDSAMIKKEEALKKYLVQYRQKYGHNATSLPILVYDYSNPAVSNFVSAKLGITKDDLLFLGTVTVENNVPTKVFTKISQPQDAEKYAHLVIQEVTGKSIAVAPSPKKTPAPAGNAGSVKVTTTPAGAKVYIGGTLKGTTPLTISGLPEGKTALTISKTGFAKTTKEVEVKKGKSADCTVTLAASAKPAVAGSIALTSTPAGGKVYVDGKYRGVSPITLTGLTPGKHKILVVKGKDKWEQSVGVEKGKKVAVKAELTKKVAVVTPKTPTPAPSDTPTPTIIETHPTPDATPTSNGEVREAFVPRSGQNEIFQVSVSNLEEVASIKDYYKPKPGYKFVVVYISQQNVSDELQVYTGQFVVVDQSNASYEPLDNLSNFWSVVLKVGGMRIGYLVFEIPADAKPMAVVLHGLKMAPLSVSLR